MIGWTPEGKKITLTPWQERSVRALLDMRRARVITIRGRQWGWSTVLETARRYDLNRALLSAMDINDLPAAESIGPPPGELPAIREDPRDQP